MVLKKQIITGGVMKSKKVRVKVLRNLTMFIVMAIMYVFIEVFFTAFSGEMSHKFGTDPLSMMGFSSVYMCFVGGVLGYILGKFNEVDFIKDRFNLFFQSLLGAILITVTELAVGFVLNVKLGFHIWDYSAYPVNFLGQISLIRSIGWFFICPLAFWFDDLVKAELYGMGKPYSLLSIYLKVFNIKGVSIKKAIEKIIREDEEKSKRD